MQHMNDQQIQALINKLEDEAKQVRRTPKHGEEEQEKLKRLGKLETEIKQYQDLLNQRRAKEEFHEDPSTAGMRDANHFDQ